MKCTSVIALCGGLALSTCATLSAFDGPGVCNGHFVTGVPDGRIVPGPVISNTTNDAALYYAGTLGHSYSVEVLANPTGGSENLGANWGGPGINCPLTSITGAGLRDTSQIDPAATIAPSNVWLRASFTAPATAIYEMRATNSGAQAVPINFSVSDTTLFSPAWSTNGSYDTYYSFLNTTSAACNATLTLYNTAGTLVLQNTVAIPPAGTAAANTAAMGAVRNTTGTAKLTNDCPPGAILATAVIANFQLAAPYNQPVPFQAVRSR